MGKAAGTTVTSFAVGVKGGCRGIIFRIRKHIRSPTDERREHEIENFVNVLI